MSRLAGIAIGQAPASSYAPPPRGPLPSQIYDRYVGIVGDAQARIYAEEAMSDLLEEDYETLSPEEKKEVDQHRADHRAAAKRQEEERQARNKAERNGMEAKRIANEAYEGNLAAYKERQAKKSFFRKTMNALTCSGEHCPVRKVGGTRKGRKGRKGRKEQKGRKTRQNTQRNRR